jgi:hypothetical protein
VSDILHCIYPLLRLMAVYSYLRDDFEAHSMAIRVSLFGVATRVHPVRSAKSLPSCFDSVWCHSSTLP